MAKRVGKNSGRTGSGSSRSTNAGKTTTSRKVSGVKKSGSTQAKSRTRSQAVRKSQRASARPRGGAAHPLTDHREIRQWAEERGAVPTCVKGTGDRGGIGMIRLEFPRFGAEPELQPISWDDWLDQFEESRLALMVQEETARGEKSNFNKLVKRGARAAAKPKVRSAH